MMVRAPDEHNQTNNALTRLLPNADRPSPDADESLARFATFFAPAERTLPIMLTRQAERHGDRLLFRAGVPAWTFRQTALIAAGMATRLAEAGLRPGDRV